MIFYVISMILFVMVYFGETEMEKATFLIGGLIVATVGHISEQLNKILEVLKEVVEVPKLVEVPSKEDLLEMKSRIKPPTPSGTNYNEKI